MCGRDRLTGGVTYFQTAVLAEVTDVRTSSPVASIVRPAKRGGTGPGPVTITTEAGHSEQYDAVVLATHRCVLAGP